MSAVVVAHTAAESTDDYTFNPFYLPVDIGYPAVPGGILSGKLPAGGKGIAAGSKKLDLFQMMVAEDEKERFIEAAYNKVVVGKGRSPADRIISMCR